MLYPSLNCAEARAARAEIQRLWQEMHQAGGRLECAEHPSYDSFFPSTGPHVERVRAEYQAACAAYQQAFDEYHAGTAHLRKVG